MQATQITGNSLSINAGTINGQTINPNAQLNIDAAIESQNQSHTSQGSDLMTQNSSNSGKISQSLNYTTINLSNNQNPTLNAAGGIVVGAANLPSASTGSSTGGSAPPTITVDLKQQATALATQPGLSYLGNLAKSNNVTWQNVQLASQSWNYSQSGLSAAGAAIIAIAVAAVTAGSASELSAALMTNAGLTGATASAASASLAAGMTSLASQAAVDLANNQGDLGKTLQVLGSNSAIRNTVAAMVTAGALTELGNTTSFTGQSGSGSLTNSTSGIATNQALNQFGQNLLNNVTNNLAGTVINSAITGKGLNESSLQTALTSALITAGMAQAANSIGDATQSGALNSYTQAVAHAIAGCAGGAAAAGNGGGCGAGAIGATVGELSAQYASSSGMTDANTLALAKVMSATAGLLVSNGDPTAVNVAASMGANAAQNNWDMHNTSKQSNGTYVNNATGEVYSAQCATTDCLLYGANRNGSDPANIAYDKKTAANGLNALGQAATVTGLAFPPTAPIANTVSAVAASGEAYLTQTNAPLVDLGVSTSVEMGLKKIGIPDAAANWAGAAAGQASSVIQNAIKK